VFVEVGPSGVLSGLTRRILASRSDITIVQFDQRGRAPVEQLKRLRETLGLAGDTNVTHRVPAADNQPSQPGRILSFDATARRRERNRSAALGKAAAPVARPPVSASHNGNGHAHGGNGSAHRPAPVPAAGLSKQGSQPAGRLLAAAPNLVSGVESGSPTAVATDQPAAVKPSQAGMQAGELETFLVDFVVEQTGYPREIVELDADLEADLGIDSIRKAQLFGEIGQKYSLAADNSLSLDDFPTLRHLLDYMVPQIAQTRPDAVAAQAAASPDQVASETYRSPQFRKGEEQGRLHAELIRNWARLLPPVAPGREPIFPRALGEELDGIAEGAGVSAAAVRAAVADPAALLGEWDVVVSEQAGSVGLVVACGRQLAPQVQSRGADAGQATLVGLPGLNAAVLGWNTSGLVAWIGERGRSAAGDLRAANPAAVAVAAVAESAQTVSEALDLLQGMAPLDGSINLMMLSTGSMQTVGINGDLHPLTTNAGSQPQGSLSRVLLASGQRSVSAGLERLLDPTTGEADRLSTAVNWLAVGRTGGLPVVRGGGPLTHWFDPQAVAIPRLASSAAAENDVQSAGSSDPGITRRYLLGCSPLSPAVAESRLDGQRVLVLGQGPLAAAVATAIRASGGDVSVATGGSHQAAEAAVDHAEAAGPVQHLILAAELSPDSVANRADAVVTAPFFACQRWIAARQWAGGLAGASLTALTRLGGDFGAGGRVVDAAGGGLAGLLKNIAHEFPELQVRIVDHGAEASEAVIAAAAVAEICHPEGPVEVGYGADGRQQPLMVEQALPATAEGLAATAAGNVWLVTGGARGVTAACGLALGQRFGLRLALVGSTEPLPIEAAWLDLDQAGLQTLKGRLMVEAKSRGEDPRQAWRAVEKSLEIARSLAACRAAGVDARYFSCDLADAAAVERLVSEVERSIGPISGLLHGAGYEAACRFEKKTAAGLAATVGPKAIGLERLVAAIDSKSLRAVIGFGSTSGRFGGHGQADYSLANDLLAKIVAKLRRDRDISATVFIGMPGTRSAWPAGQRAASCWSSLACSSCHSPKGSAISFEKLPPVCPLPK